MTSTHSDDLAQFGDSRIKGQGVNKNIFFLQSNPFGNCEVRHKPQVEKNNRTTPSEGMEGPRVTKLGIG